MAKPKDKGKSSKGTVFGGLNKDRYEKKARGADRVQIEQGKSVTVQFVAPIDDQDLWKEIDQHQFQEKGWKYVPCLGDGCPLCEDDDKDVSKTTYRFFTVVWDFKEKRLAILEGPKDLSGRIARRFASSEKKKKGSFLDKTFLVTKNKTTPVSYDVEAGEKKVVKIDTKNLPNLDEYILDQKQRYFGDDLPKASKKKGGKKGKDQKTAMDDDAAEDDILDKSELQELSDKKLVAYAKSTGIKKPDVSDRKALIKQILKKQG